MNRKIELEIKRVLAADDETSFEKLLELTSLNRATDFKNADLSGVDFGMIDLEGFDFTNSNLTDSNLSHAKNLSKAIFDGVTFGSPLGPVQEWQPPEIISFIERWLRDIQSLRDFRLIARRLSGIHEISNTSNTSNLISVISNYCEVRRRYLEDRFLSDMLEEFTNLVLGNLRQKRGFSEYAPKLDQIENSLRSKHTKRGRIVDLLVDLKLTQVALARRATISPTVISNLTRGSHFPLPETRRAIVSAMEGLGSSLGTIDEMVIWPRVRKFPIEYR